jgi:hypothetical protein
MNEEFVTKRPRGAQPTKKKKKKPSQEEEEEEVLHGAHATTSQRTAG